MMGKICKYNLPSIDGDTGMGGRMGAVALGTNVCFVFSLYNILDRV